MQTSVHVLADRGTEKSDHGCKAHCFLSVRDDLARHGVCHCRQRRLPHPVIMFGYVITNNCKGSDRGFWSPFPRFVVFLSDMHFKYVSMLDKHGNMRHRWDYWNWRDEIEFRQSADYNGK